MSNDCNLLPMQAACNVPAQFATPAPGNAIGTPPWPNSTMPARGAPGKRSRMSWNDARWSVPVPRPRSVDGWFGPNRKRDTPVAFGLDAESPSQAFPRSIKRGRASASADPRTPLPGRVLQARNSPAVRVPARMRSAPVPESSRAGARIDTSATGSGGKLFPGLHLRLRPRPGPCRSRNSPKLTRSSLHSSGMSPKVSRSVSNASRIYR